MLNIINRNIVNIDANDIMFSIGNVKTVFNPFTLPLDDKSKKLLLFWLKRFIAKVPVDSDLHTINANKTISFDFKEVADLLQVPFEKAVVICKNTADLFQFNSLEWEIKQTDKTVHFLMIQDTTIWFSKSQYNSMDITFGEVFAYILPKLYSIYNF